MEKAIQFLMFFIIYSFLGWILESIYKTISQKKPVNSGFLYGPFCPIYGIGAIIMYLFLYDFKGNTFLIFCLGFVVLSVWEYLVSVLLEKFFHTRYWDYSHKKYNLQGRVCLANSIYWGILGIVFMQFIHPGIQQLLNLIPIQILQYISIIFIAYFIIDTVTSVIAINHINVKLTKLSELNQAIKDRIEEIKLLGQTAKSDTIQAAIEELNLKKAELKETLAKKLNRLKKAFPTMKSESLTEFFLSKENRKKDKKE